MQPIFGSVCPPPGLPGAAPVPPPGTGVCMQVHVARMQIRFAFGLQCADHVFHFLGFAIGVQDGHDHGPFPDRGLFQGRRVVPLAPLVRAKHIRCVAGSVFMFAGLSCEGGATWLMHSSRHPPNPYTAGDAFSGTIAAAARNSAPLSTTIQQTSRSDKDNRYRECAHAQI